VSKTKRRLATKLVHWRVQLFVRQFRRVWVDGFHTGHETGEALCVVGTHCICAKFVWQDHERGGSVLGHGHGLATFDDGGNRSKAVCTLEGTTKNGHQKFE
jgi:hypothetical protein